MESNCLFWANNARAFLYKLGLNLSNPTKIIPEADKRNLDYYMCTSYTDGTKVAIENAIVANALNCSVLEPGMNGKSMDFVHDIFNHYDFESLYKKNGMGVFTVGYCANEYQQSMLDWFPSSDMGKDGFNIFYRPYHLCHVETMRTVVEAVLDKKSLLNPKYGFRTNVYSYAKKDIKKEGTTGMWKSCLISVIK